MSDAGTLVGVAGWIYDDWKDVVYPTSEKDKLAWLAQYLDCVEINSSFYHPFSESVAQKWLKSVESNPRFQFTGKAWQRFTHETDKPYSEADVRNCLAGFQALADGGRFAALLFQFPFYFEDGVANRDLLKRLADDFGAFRRVVEVRHTSWAEPGALAFIESLGYSVACLDMPLSRTSFREDALVTGGLGYLRLHGRNYKAWFSKEADRDEKYNYLYTDEDLDGVLERIRRLREAADSVVVIWNNHYRGKAAVNAFQTLSSLKGERVDVPAPLQAAYPQLREAAKREKGLLF